MRNIACDGVTEPRRRTVHVGSRYGKWSAVLLLIGVGSGCATLTLERRSVPEGRASTYVRDGPPRTVVLPSGLCADEWKRTTVTRQRYRTRWGKGRVGAKAYRGEGPAVGLGGFLAYELGVGGLAFASGVACLTGTNGMPECEVGKDDYRAAAWGLTAMGVILLTGAVVDAVAAIVALVPSVEVSEQVVVQRGPARLCGPAGAGVSRAEALHRAHHDQKAGAGPGGR